jgi:hypothetical protein
MAVRKANKVGSAPEPLVYESWNASEIGRPWPAVGLSRWGPPPSPFSLRWFFSVPSPLIPFVGSWYNFWCILLGPRTAFLGESWQKVFFLLSWPMVGPWTRWWSVMWKGSRKGVVAVFIRGNWVRLMEAVKWRGSTSKVFMVVVGPWLSNGG